MTPIPDRLAQIAREIYRKNLDTAYDLDSQGLSSNEYRAAAVAQRWAEERLKEQTERVCPACGRLPGTLDNWCYDCSSALIYRFEYERREGRT